MKTTTESDIPQLFRQFSGNSANYQELTRAAAARASQARWPLLSAVELEQGDIPAVIDPQTGLAVLETTSLQTKTAVDEPAVGGADAVPFAVLTEIIPDAAPTTGEILALAKDEGVSLSKDEILALVDIEAQQAPEAPVPVIVPGTNTIFMAPAPFSARHFAQVERALAARREAAMADIPVQADSTDTVLSGTPLRADAAMGNVAVQADVTDAAMADIASQADVADAAPITHSVADSAVAAAREQQPSPAATPSADAAHTLAALSAELAAALPREAIAPVAEVAKVEVVKVEVTKMEVTKVETPSAAPHVQPLVSAPAPRPKVAEAAPPILVMPSVAAPALKISPAAAQTPIPAAQAAPAKAAAAEAAAAEAAAAEAAPANPASSPIFRPAAPAAVPAQPKVAAHTLLRASAPPVAAPQALATPGDASPVKHAGLKPLFERLAAPEETTSPVKSLFSRLLQS